MFKRIILILVLSLSVSGLNRVNAATSADYRSYANTYLKSAATYALSVYQSAKGSESADAYLAYLYSYYARYNGEVAAWIAQLGNPAITETYNRLTYVFSTYATEHARKTYVKSSAKDSASAYLSYLYTYLGSVYAYYAYLVK